MSRDSGTEPASVAVEAAGTMPDLRRFSREAMHTVFEVYAVHPDARYAAQAASAAFDLIDRLEADLSRFIANSDIARVNRLAAGESTRVAESTLECLVIARHVFDLTGGAFDPSIGSGLPLLDLDGDEFVVRAAKEGVRLDLGAIGKGFAVDLAAGVLEEWGLTRGLVHGGFSSVLALDAPEGRDGWPLTLSDPRSPSRVLARLSVRQAALAASGLQKGNHIVDPRTGRPPRGRVAAWSSVPRPRPETADGSDIRPLRAATVADALTTAFMVLKPAEIQRLCETNPGLEAWLLLPGSAAPVAPPPLLHFGTQLP